MNEVQLEKLTKELKGIKALLHRLVKAQEGENHACVICGAEEKDRATISE